MWSKKFAFSANAKPFVPAFIEEKMKVETKMKTEHKIQTLEAQLEEENLSKMRLIKSYQREKLKINSLSEKNLKDLEKENKRLNKEIREGVTKLFYERDRVKERDTLLIKKQEKISSLERDITSLLQSSRYRIAELEDVNSNLNRNYEEIKTMHANIENEQQNLLEKKDEWVGRCLRLDFIFKKMKQIGALSEDHDEWVAEMVEDIEFPNGSNHNSIYLSLPRYVRNKYLPSESDADIQVVLEDDEINIIEDLSREAQAFNQNLSEHFRRNLDENPEIIMNHIRTIQSRYREHISSNREQKNKAAIKIQSIWRGFISRGIITYKGTLEVNDSLTIYKLIPDKKIKSTYQIVPEHMGNRAIRINFANTSKNIIHYQWMKIQPHTLEGTVGTEFSIKPGEFIPVKSYFGHWFRFMVEAAEKEQFFRIMPEGFLGILGRNMWSNPTAEIIQLEDIVFDLNTKLTITKDHYDEWSRGVLRTHAIRVPNTNNSDNISEEDRINIIEDEEDTDDEATLQLAIQLSLETFTSLTSGMSDLNIGDLFQ